MKALGICGSPRSKGNTYRLVKAALEPIEAAGVETELVELADLDIRPCRACLECKGKEYCQQDDDFNPVFDKMKAAEAILLGSPVHFGSATANLISLLDRAGYVDRVNKHNFFVRKVGGPIVVARRAGQNFTFAQLNYFFLINEMIVPGSTYWNVAFGCEKGEVHSDAEGLDTVKTLAQNMAWLLRKLHAGAEEK